MQKIEILDHGYIELVDSWGSDESIIEAARMSTAKGFEGWGEKTHYDKCPNYGEPLTYKCDDCGHAPGDEKLLAYLWKHKHSTPFEMAGLIIEVKAPIFVFREWHRHRTQSYNEMSARYIPLPDENYSPDMARLFLNLTDTSKNKQAGTIVGAPILTEDAAQNWLAMLEAIYAQSEFVYKRGLAQGVPKELARLCIPVGRYSRMRASANLRNWLGFLSLRMDAAAQWEIRQYANAVAEILTKLYPRTMELFMESFSNGKAA